MFLSLSLAVVIPASLMFWLISLFYQTINRDYAAPAPWRWLVAAIAPVLIALYGLRKRSLDVAGAVAGLLVGFILTLSSLCFFSALLVFFLAGSKVTKLRAHQKKKFEEDYKEGGQRNWLQVMCNGGVASLFAILYLLEVGCAEKTFDFSRRYSSTWWAASVLGSLACCCGDTFASEVGTVFGHSKPWLVTNFQRVPRGTNGGVTFTGTLSSIFGGFIVGVAYYVALLLCTTELSLSDSPPQWPILLLATSAGFVGSIIDSYLGALLQFSGYDRRRACIVEHPGPHVEHISGYAVLDNHGVNLLSSLLTGIISPYIAWQLWLHVT
ncbi:transmembrane protein 19-like [Haliotis rufescens]|uniref:transmembrane protein 19-like n=1 Tax=Haliotis rufescens TaxID=6454 RepID=UPI00201E9216|nr:transmembrane protein 19-like [Haliotis rufescens]